MICKKFKFSKLLKMKYKFKVKSKDHNQSISKIHTVPINCKSSPTLREMKLHNRNSATSASANFQMKVHQARYFPSHKT